MVSSSQISNSQPTFSQYSQGEEDAARRNISAPEITEIPGFSDFEPLSQISLGSLGGLSFPEPSSQVGIDDFMQQLERTFQPER